MTPCATLVRHLAHRSRIVHNRLYDTVRLPLGARLARLAAEGVLRGRSVLLVDDDPVVRLILGSHLRHASAEVDEATDGKEVVDCALRQGRSHDAIVMDEHMPALSGAAATRRIRAHQGSQGQRPTPILGVSSDAGARTRRFIGAGMNAHLAKPFGRDEFIAAVQRLLASG
ncbi:MAG TPA: response regulator [Methylibium sp.]|uniref:response regulator n=1 Tax=Methylibium sp. TaxID=2067992 RepID=UPI002DB7DF03|nr:response regulator [Methylibium sp.]HEU4457565.1 response regulator [Methylibium sp.]